MRRFLIKIGIEIGIAAALCSCSSVPDFKPSKPVEEAASLAEGLDLCASYEIDGKKNEAGRALPERAVVLTPWLRCFETVLRKFSDARHREDLVAFFRALQSRHDGSPPDSAVIDWPAMNFAVRHAVDRLKNVNLPYTQEGIQAIERQLPGYAIYLHESGLSTRQYLTAKDDSSPLRIPKASPAPLPLTAEQKQYCKKFKNHRTLVYNIEELSKYKATLEGQTYADAGNAGEKALRDRVNARLASMRKESEGVTQELARELSRLQLSSNWFRDGHCL